VSIGAVPVNADARDADRRALARSVQAGRVTVVNIAALDRLGRSTRIILDRVDTITEAGAALVRCRERLAPTSAAGTFVLTIFAALAQMEREVIVKRTRDGRNRRGRRDGDTGGNIPSGYQREHGAIVVVTTSASVVRRVCTLRALVSLHSIAGKLNSEDVPTPNGGKFWYASTVRHLLIQETMYRGGRRGERTASWPVLRDSTVPSPRRRRVRAA
jgi:DNA invertase Pin-like site-specific DNA recombinase